jgi:hypothetical protein
MHQVISMDDSVEKQNGINNDLIASQYEDDIKEELLVTISD